MAYDRITRKIQNSKESSVASGDTKNVVSHFPSLNSMKEGEQVYSQEVNKPIALYKKHKGKLYKSYFSDNGNFIVDNNINIGRSAYLNDRLYIKDYPAFRVYFDSGQTLTNATTTILTFNSTISQTGVVAQYDNGNHIDFNNEAFVVPYNGIYAFSARVLYDSESSHYVHKGEVINFEIFVDATTDLTIVKTQEVAHEHFESDINWYSEVYSEAKLNQGDLVKIRIYNGTGTNILTSNDNDVTFPQFSHFTGHLICPIS